MEDNQTEIRKLSAIMFSDIEGYSRLMQNDEKKTLALLEEHNAILFPIIQNHKGTIIKTVGDAILAVFDSCISAIDSAVEIQQALAKRAATPEIKETLRVRIGLHLGETVYVHNDVFGNGVNIAARLQPLSDPGGICLSQTVYDQIMNHYGNKITKVGPVNLKNISEPVVIYRMQVEGGVDTKDVKGYSIPLKPAVAEKGQEINHSKDNNLYAETKIGMRDKILAIFSGISRKGKWSVPKKLKIVAVFGGVELDLRDATFESPNIEIHVVCVFGGVEISTPKNVIVETNGFAIFGGFEGKSQHPDYSTMTDKININIKGVAVFGGVEVK